MIIGAFYWQMLFFGGIVVLISGIGVFEQLQQHTLDAGGVGFGIGFGLVLYGPLVLVQLPGMPPDDQFTFGVGAAVGFVLGAVLVTASALLLLRRRRRSPRDEAKSLTDESRL